MNENKNEITGQKSLPEDRMLYALVRWNDGRVIHRGTVFRVFTRHGIKYLDIMSILGKRHIVRASRVKLLYSENKVER